jgi:hypothetical protein
MAEETRKSDDPKRRDFKLCARPIVGEGGEKHLEQFENNSVPIFQVITEHEHICFYAHKPPTGINKPHFFVNYLNFYIRALQQHLQDTGWLPLDGTTDKYLPRSTEDVQHP